MLGLLYQAYALLMVPALQPLRTSRPVFETDHAGQSDIPQDDEYEQVAKRHLPHHPWATRAKFKFQHEGNFYFCGDGQPTSDHEAVEVTPFAMVMGSLGDDQTPVVVTSESALVTFDRSVELTEIRPEMLTRVLLKGEVKVTGPDQLEIVGREFIFERQARPQHLRSDYPITFRYGPNHGRARSVEIGLNTHDAITDSNLTAESIRNVRLRHDVFMELHAEREKPPLNVGCTGYFELNLQSRTASFHENVAVLRESIPQQFDRLKCQQLAVKFQRVTESEQAFVDGEDESEGSQKERIEVTSLNAKGPRMVISSDEHKLVAYPHELNYDVARNLLHLTHPQTVRIVQQQVEMECPEISFTHNKEGEVVSAKCVGAGWAKQIDPQRKLTTFDVTWQKRVQLDPDESDVALRKVTLEGRVTFRHIIQQAGITAGLVQLWLERSPDEKPKHTSTVGSQRQPNSIDSLASNANLVLRRVIADRGIYLLSRQLEGNVDRIEVVVSDQRRSLTESETDSDPAANSEETNSDKLSQTWNPLHLEGGRITIHAIPTKNNSSFWIDGLSIDGDFELTQNDAGKNEVLSIQGNRVLGKHLEGPPNSQLWNLKIHGDTAQIRQGESLLDAKSIFISTNENSVTIPVGGFLQTEVSNTLEGEELQTPQHLRVWWNESMTFDGQAAHFLGNIVGQLAEARLKCEAMDVSLDRALNFAQLSDQRNKPKQQRTSSPEIQKLVCKHQVQIDLHRYTDKRLFEVVSATADNIVFEQFTGDIFARGPGQVRHWKRKDSPQRKFSMVNFQEDESSSSAKGRQPHWEFTELNFAREMQGNLNKGMVTLDHRIEMVHGPVAKPLVVLNREELPEDGVFLSCDHATLLQRNAQGLLNQQQEKEKTKEKSPMQITAEGNAVIRGVLFQARANRIQYDEENDLFTIRSEGSDVASIWHRERYDAVPTSVDAKVIHFAPVRNYLEFDQVILFRGSR